MLVRTSFVAGTTTKDGSGGLLTACACFNARSAARVISDLYDRTLAPTGLKLSQFAILAAIRQRHGATMQELAAELGLDPSTMTRTLRPLEDAGLVRTQPGGDKRAKALELTLAGDDALGRASALWDEAQRTLRAKIGDAVFERLNADLAAVAQALRT
jgi:DNA-binding MarR family transcriptional regulator